MSCCLARQCGRLLCRSWSARYCGHAVGRMPLIKFPQRRTTDGKPVVVISVEHLHRQRGDLSTRTVELPPHHGRRLPIPEEEVETINLGGAR